MRGVVTTWLRCRILSGIVVIGFFDTKLPISFSRHGSCTVKVLKKKFNLVYLTTSDEMCKFYNAVNCLNPGVKVGDILWSSGWG